MAKTNSQVILLKMYFLKCWPLVEQFAILLLRSPAGQISNLVKSEARLNLLPMKKDNTEKLHMGKKKSEP